MIEGLGLLTQPGIPPLLKHNAAPFRAALDQATCREIPGDQNLPESENRNVRGSP